MSGVTQERYTFQLADPGELGRHRPDAHWQLVREKNVLGQCSLWWHGTPGWKHHRVGMIGHYAASGGAGVALLNHACRQLAEQGCSLAVGPMDGSTWRSYRLITRSTDQPRFFLEPDNSPEWVEHFVESGFEPLATYFSALNDNLEQTDPRIQRHVDRLFHMGITLHSLRREDFEHEVKRMMSVARAAFRDNLLYSDPEESEFVDTYHPLLDRVPLELIWLAEHSGRPVGFAFGIPDFCERARGERIRTLIVKTLAVVPERQYAGLGKMLLAELQQRARSLGFTRAIHALVRDAEHLKRISRRYAVPIREYTLFAKVLPQ